MTAKVTIDPGSHAVQVFVVGDDGKDICDYIVPAGSIRTFHVTGSIGDMRSIRVEELVPEGSNVRIDQPEPTAPGYEDPDARLKASTDRLDGDI